MCDYGSKRANAGSEPVRYMEMDPCLSLRHFQTDLPIHRAGPLYKGLGPKENRTNGVFMVHMSRTDQPMLWGHNSQFNWVSARVKSNTCFSRPLSLYYSHPNVHN